LSGVVNIRVLAQVSVSGRGPSTLAAEPIG